jgi:hypothetical protein
MKKSILVLLFLLSISIVYSQPKLEIVGGNTYNWGKVYPKNSPLSTKITIKNTGNELLKVVEVKPGCGCTTAPIQKNELKPNETTTIDVNLNITSYTGDIVKSVRITTNDPSSPDTYLYLKANVFRPIIITPGNYLGKSVIYTGTETNFEYKLKNITDKPINIKEVTFSPAEAKIDIKKGDVLPPNQERAFTIKFYAKDKGRLNGNLHLKTDYTDDADINIFFYGNITEPPVEEKTTGDKK